MFRYREYQHLKSDFHLLRKFFYMLHFKQNKNDFLFHIKDTLEAFDDFKNKQKSVQSNVF